MKIKCYKIWRAYHKVFSHHAIAGAVLTHAGAGGDGHFRLRDAGLVAARRTAHGGGKVKRRLWALRLHQHSGGRRDEDFSRKRSVPVVNVKEPGSLINALDFKRHPHKPTKEKPTKAGVKF